MRDHVCVALWCVAVLGIVACEPPAATTPATTASVARTASPTPPEPVRPPPIERAAVERVLETWRASQNKGDFEAYASLYASKLLGIKRVGPRVYRFGRDGWIADRKRMFGKAIEVRVTEPEIAIQTGAAVVQFEQTWASGTFKDVGRKQLVIVQEGDHLKIAREEMLASQVLRVASSKERAPLAPGRYAPIVRYGEVHLALLTPYDRGRPRARQGVRSLAFGRAAMASLPQAEMPEGLDAWVPEGKVFAIMADGTYCVAKIVAPRVLAELVPHFGTMQAWRGEEGGPKLRDEDVAAEVMVTGRRHVAVELELASGCPPRHEPVTALPFGAKVNVAMPHDDVAMRGAIRDAFRRLPAWGALQKAFAETGSSGKWDAQPHTRVWMDAEGTYFGIASAFVDRGCGEFYGALSAMWRRPKGSARWQLLGTVAPKRAAEPVVVLDVDGNGEMEFVTPRRLIRRQGAVWRQVVEFEVPDYDCPC